MPTEEYWISTTEKVEYMEQTVNRIADELTVIFVDVIGSCWLSVRIQLDSNAMIL